MKTILIANPKGGSGKTTLSVNIAGYLANRGQRVAMLDLDRQQSSALWLATRADDLPRIRTLDSKKEHDRPNDWLVIDSPAGLHGKRLKEILKRAHKVVVPLQPSVFDIFATQDFLNELADSAQAAKIEIGIVGMRVDERTRAAEQLRTFVEATGLSVLGYVRDTQNYVQLAAHGLTVFDLPPERLARDLVQWQPICRWLDQ